MHGIPFQRSGRLLFFFTAVFSFLLAACKEEPLPEGPYEPIIFIQPDTNYIYADAGENLDLEIDLLAEDDIVKLMADYRVDDTGTAVPVLDLDFPEEENQETYTGVFGVPGYLVTDQYIRCTYYLYHADTPVYSKILRINIR